MSNTAILDGPTVSSTRGKAPKENWGTKPELKPERKIAPVIHANDADSRLLVFTDEDSDVNAIRHIHLRNKIADPETQVIEVNEKNLEKELTKVSQDDDIGRIGILIRSGHNSANLSNSRTKEILNLLSRFELNKEILLAADGSFNNPAATDKLNNSRMMNHRALPKFFHQHRLWNMFKIMFDQNFQRWLDAKILTPPSGIPELKPGYYATYRAGTRPSTTVPEKNIRDFRYTIHQPGKVQNEHNLEISPEIAEFFPFVDKVFGLAA